MPVEGIHIVLHPYKEKYNVDLTGLKLLRAHLICKHKHYMIMMFTNLSPITT